jgi:hypothetical protein
MDDDRYTVFAGNRKVAAGGLREVLPVLKQRFDEDPGETVLVFEDATGRQIDFDLRGSPEDVMARALPSAPRGPGRPKLGVTPREVTLLPRHWSWLEQQPEGISAALRRLVEHAMKQPRARDLRAIASRVLTGIAGDRPHFEEVTRALFAGDTARLESLVQKWPRDIREHAIALARAADAARS